VFEPIAFRRSAHLEKCVIAARDVESDLVLAGFHLLSLYQVLDLATDLVAFPVEVVKTYVAVIYLF
jgi:hypothetical protein